MDGRINGKEFLKNSFLKIQSMLKLIRNLNFGYIVFLTGIIFIIAGVSWTSDKDPGATFLCFDQGCIYIQGLTSVFLGLFFIVLGVYIIMKRRRRI